MSLDDKFSKKEIIYGPMACGKSLELMRRIKRVEHFASKFNYSIEIFKPVLDKRGSEKDEEDKALCTLISRTGLKQEGNITLVKTATDIFQHFLKTRKVGQKTLIAIDEVQLLDSHILDVAEKLRQRDCYVLMAGLDLSFRGEPFPFSDFHRTMHDLINSIPEDGRYQLTALCDVCGSESAEYTQRVLNGNPAPYYDPLIKIGYGYEARCKKHFQTPGKNDYQFIEHLIKNNPGITIDNLLDLSKTLAKIPPETTTTIITVMCQENKAIQDEHKKIYVPFILQTNQPNS